MRKVILALMCMAAVTMFTACGGGNQKSGTSQQEQGATAADKEQNASQTGDVAVSKFTSPGDYTEGALKKMKSLGKTVKNERLVTVGGNSDSSTYEVFLYKDGKRSSHESYTFYTVKQKKLYDAVTEYTDRNMEVNGDDLWVCHKRGKDGDTSWEDDYKGYKSIPMTKIVE